MDPLSSQGVARQICGYLRLVPVAYIPKVPTHFSCSLKLDHDSLKLDPDRFFKHLIFIFHYYLLFHYYANINNMSKDLKWVIDDLRGRSGSKVVTGELNLRGRCAVNLMGSLRTKGGHSGPK